MTLMQCMSDISTETACRGVGVPFDDISTLQDDDGLSWNRDKFRIVELAKGQAQGAE